MNTTRWRILVSALVALVSLGLIGFLATDGNDGQLETRGESENSEDDESETTDRRSRGPGSGDKSTTTASSGGGTTGGQTGTTGTGPSVPGGPKAQFITFDAWIRPVRLGFSEPIGATASSGLPVSYTLRPGSSRLCQIVGSSLVVDPMQVFPREGDTEEATFPKPCIVEASQPGGPGFLPATSVVRELVVERVKLLLQVSRPEVLEGRMEATVTVTDPTRLASHAVPVITSGPCEVDWDRIVEDKDTGTTVIAIVRDPDSTTTSVGAAECELEVTPEGELVGSAFTKDTATVSITF